MPTKLSEDGVLEAVGLPSAQNQRECVSTHYQHMEGALDVSSKSTSG